MTEPFLGTSPQFDDSVFIADTARVIGDVRLGSESSVWFGAVLRGDVNRIRIGARSNVQDNAVVHVTNRTAPTTIGDRVTVGHSAVVHGCTVEDDVLVGIGAVILDHAIIGHDSLVGARALVTGGLRIPPRSLVLGTPARVVRELTEEEILQVHEFARNYVRYARIYRGVDRPDSNPFYEAE